MEELLNKLWSFLSMASYKALIKKEIDPCQSEGFSGCFEQGEQNSEKKIAMKEKDFFKSFTLKINHL
jgi:hypothetical protein